MAKYSKNLKLKAIEMYKSDMGSTTICAQLKIAKAAKVLRWIYLFDKYGFN